MKALLEQLDARLALVDPLWARLVVFFVGNFLALCLVGLVGLSSSSFGNFLIGLGIGQIVSITLWPLGMGALAWWFVAVVLTQTRQSLAWLMMVVVLLFSGLVKMVANGGWLTTMFVAEFILIAIAVFWLRSRWKK